jgi:glycosyltransferase involved in cell wall biosynthesis
LRRIIDDAPLRARLRRNALERAKADFDPVLAQQTLLRDLGYRAPGTRAPQYLDLSGTAPQAGREKPRLAPDHLRIVQVSGYDLLGAQVNGYLLHKFLEERGQDSHMLVYRKSSGDENVHQLGSPILERLNNIAGLAQKAISTHCVLPVLSAGIADLPWVANADIVNLQLLHNAQYFSLLQLPRLSRGQRVVLSVHDMFLFTGHCVYSLGCERWRTGCGACPDLEIPFRMLSDTTALNWKLKRWIFGRSRLDLVVGSRWQAERVKASPILGHLPLHYIPYGVDTRAYKPKEKAAVREAGMPRDAQVIAFRSVPTGMNFKGTEYIEAALQRYVPPKDTWLLTFEQKQGLDSLRGKYRFLELGWVTDTDAIAEGLCAADLFLMPSIAEAFGLMAVESMACGTPVIVFEGTALPETINAPECGIAVPYKDSEALARAIARYSAILVAWPSARERAAPCGGKPVSKPMQRATSRHRRLAETRAAHASPAHAWVLLGGGRCTPIADDGWWHVPGCARLPARGHLSSARDHAVGMRSSRDSRESPPGRSASFLGDSYTAGDGVSNLQRFTDLLEACYPHLDALNFGLNGSGTDQQLLVFETIARHYAADAYVWCICVENIARNLYTCFPSFDFREQQLVFRPKPYFELTGQGLALRNQPVPLEKRKKDALGDWRCSFPYVPGSSDAYAIYGHPERAHWRTMKAILQRFIMQAGGKPVLIVPLPMYNHYLEESPPTYWRRFMELEDRPANVFAVDLLPAFVRVPRAEREALRFGDDPHYTARAHALVANTLEAALTECCPGLLQP